MCPFHQSEGGHRFNGGISFPIERCSSCVGGICRCAMACELPDAEPQPADQDLSILPFACFGAIAGLAALAYVVQALNLF